MIYFLGIIAPIFLVATVVLGLKFRRSERLLATQTHESDRLKDELASVRKHYESECTRILQEAQKSIAIAQKAVDERLAESEREVERARAGLEVDFRRIQTEASRQSEIARQKYEAEAARIRIEGLEITRRAEELVRLDMEKHRAETQQYKSKLSTEAEILKQRFEEEAARIRAEGQEAYRRGEELVGKELERQRAEAERVRQHYQGEALRVQSEAEATIRNLREKLKALDQLQELAQNAEQAKAMLTAALTEGAALRDEAKALVEGAKMAGDETRAEASQRAKEIRHHAEAILSQATRDAGNIVARAHSAAEAIAGDAYVALREKDRLERAAVAIRNVVEGYGDRYIIPTRSLLDELASDFGHMEAGQALASAREHSKRMVVEGQAADCEYVEAARRETAIRFVIDAFNGRVDAILTRTKHDNFGSLEQEIRDAYALVNLNGRAFRDARVTEGYLEARLAELRWAVVAQELRLKEREEQRLIKEQMREEEKARREYERAIQDAQREEEILMKALEKARMEAASATNEQKAKFEAHIALLNQKLVEAEAKNQRAVSMAQQTKRGNIYIISNVGSFGEDVFKIGMTRRLEPFDRVKELGDASVPFEFDVHAMIPCEDAPAFERLLHNEFGDLRINQVNFRKEFFKVPLERLRKFVAEQGIEASFTILADAKDYRESVRLLQMTPEEREKYFARSGFPMEIRTAGAETKLEVGI